jgi:hypothetical protein
VHDTKLEVIVSGLDGYEGCDHSARDIQFELAVAARLALGGFALCDGEPDLRLAWGRVSRCCRRVRLELGPGATRHRADEGRCVSPARLRGTMAVTLDARVTGLAMRSGCKTFYAEVDNEYRGVRQIGGYYALAVPGST